MYKNNIKLKRIAKRIKQKDMAKTLGITQQYLSKLESGNVDLKISTLKQIADVLDVSVGDLIE